MITLKHETVNADSELSRCEDGLKKLRARKDIGFLQLPARLELWKACAAQAEKVKGRVGVLGIGGSSLGGRALMDALGSKKVEFFENVDGKDFWTRIEALKDIRDMHWVIISKSGSTIETLGQASFLIQHLENLKISWKDRFTVVTESKSNPLNNWAKSHGISILEVPVDVGGRFSVLSPVGMFPAAAAGLDIEQIRQGAEWALTQDKLITKLMAQSLKSWDRQEWISLFWVYCNNLYTSGLWIQQLWAESLAKKTDRKGKAAPRVSSPMSLVGANDQHSVLQQVAEGARDKFIWFVRVTESETAGPKLERSLFSNQPYLTGKTMGAMLAAEAQATAKALQQNNVQSLTLELDRLDAFNMGAFFMLMELVVGSLGEVLDINAFDQPGVELGKRLALDILK